MIIIDLLRGSVNKIVAKYWKYKDLMSNILFLQIEHPKILLLNNIFLWIIILNIAILRIKVNKTKSMLVIIDVK